LIGELTRCGAVVRWSFLGTIRGLRVVGLAAFAFVPSLIVLSLVSVHSAAGTLANAAEGLFAELTLPIVVMVVVLVIAVAQFRNEIDAETLVYLSDRSITRPTIVLGKYLGAVAASLVLVVPAALVPLGVAELAGGTPYAAEVPLVLLGAAILAVLVYVAFFLFLGLASRSALIIGLIFGFLWEELLPMLPGDFPRVTFIFYLRSFISGVVPGGPLSGYPAAVPVPLSVATLVGIAVAFVVISAGVFRYLETAPGRESA